MPTRNRIPRYTRVSLALVCVSVLGFVTHSAVTDDTRAPFESSYTLAAPILDIATTPKGTILVTAAPNMVTEIRPEGVETLATIPLEERVLVNGLVVAGDDDYIVSTGGADLAVGAALWRVSGGRVELVSDIHAYESAHDPDVLGGSGWKHPACEDDSLQGFTAGPQSNPYHLARLASGKVLIADAAGNALLESSADGTLDWVAVFNPPLDNNGEWGFFRQAEGNAEIACYIQPVPTSVAVSDDGAYYVGELTGMPAAAGWSRVWRIAPGARNVVCPSDDCEVVLSDLTSVVDLEFGSDGHLYVVELDTHGWLAAVTGNPAGGRIQRCELPAGDCSVVYESDMSVAAIAFDEEGRLWAAENEVLIGEGAAVVRQVVMD